MLLHGPHRTRLLAFWVTAPPSQDEDEGKIVLDATSEFCKMVEVLVAACSVCRAVGELAHVAG